MDDPLTAMLAAWRADIDSVPFAHQAECDKIICALLGDRASCPRSAGQILLVAEHGRGERLDGLLRVDPDLSLQFVLAVGVPPEHVAIDGERLTTRNTATTDCPLSRPTTH